MKIKKLFVALTATASLIGIVACGSEEIKSEAAAETTQNNLLTDDGVGIIFTNYSNSESSVAGIPAQFKLYDNELRLVVNGDSNGNSTYVLQYVRAKLVIFGLEFDGETIDEIVCEENETEDQQLIFDRLVPNQFNGYHPGKGLGWVAGLNWGIAWQDLISMKGIPLVQNRELNCTGGSKNFTAKLFKDLEVSDDRFTLYFPFDANVDRVFRGKIVVTKEGKKPSADGKILIFE